MRINVAHLRDQGIDFLVFDADATSRFASDRAEVLQDLKRRANIAGLRAQKAALAFTEGGRPTFYGTRDLVDYLSARPSAIRWTHTLDI